MTTPHSSAQLSLNFISTKASAWPRVREDGCSISRHLDGAPQLFGAIGLLLLLTFSNTAPAQNLPVAHWINDAGDDAVTVLNAGGVFITSFKAHNDLKVTQLSGQVTSIYL